MSELSPVEKNLIEILAKADYKIAELKSLLSDLDAFLDDLEFPLPKIFVLNELLHRMHKVLDK